MTLSLPDAAIGSLITATATTIGFLVKTVFYNKPNKPTNGYVSKADFKELERENSNQHGAIQDRVTDVAKGIGRIEGHLGIRVQE